MSKAVLFIDNELTVHLALGITFRTVKDFQVYFATNESEAMSILLNHEIHAVVSDYNLSDTTGIDLLLKVKSKFPALKTAIMSGDDRDDLRRACLIAGIDHLFLKATLNKTVVPVLRSLLEESSGLPG